MAMFVGVTTAFNEVEVKTETELVNAGASTIVPDSFFDSWRWGDDSSDEEFEDDLGSFTEFFEKYTPEDDDTVMVDVQHTSEYVNVSAIAAEEFVGSTARDDTEEWLLDSGAT
jgi:hypothetical protein